MIDFSTGTLTNNENGGFLGSKVEHLKTSLSHYCQILKLFHVLHPVFLYCSVADGQPNSTVSFRDYKWSSKFPFFHGIYFPKSQSEI